MSSIAFRFREYFFPTRPTIPDALIENPRTILYDILRMYFLEKWYDLDHLTARFNTGGGDYVEKSFIVTILGLGDPYFEAQDIQGEEGSKAELRVNRRMKLFDTISQMNNAGSSIGTIKETIRADYAGDLNGREKWLVETVALFTQDSRWKHD